MSLISLALPPQISVIKALAACIAAVGHSISSPRSNLWEDSELKANFFEVLFMQTGLKLAASRKISFVVSKILSSLPPKIPARQSGFFSSQITSVCGGKTRLISSSPKNSSPSFAKRTFILPPSILLKSKACKG